MSIKFLGALNLPRFFEFHLQTDTLNRTVATADTFGADSLNRTSALMLDGGGRNSSSNWAMTTTVVETEEWTDYWTTPLNEDQDYITFSSWWDELIVTGIIPLSALVVFNSRIYLKLRASDR